MESVQHLWEFISTNGLISAVLGTVLATGLIACIVSAYKRFRHKGLLPIPLTPANAAGKNPDPDLLDSLLEPAPGILPLKGRQGELEELHAFIHDKKLNLGIILLTGGGGIGKTRLAEEVCASLAANRWRWWKNWDAGFLNPSVDSSSAFFEREHLSRWWNWKKTLVVFDETVSKRDLLKGLLSRLEEKSGKWKKKFFLILIDRSKGRDSGIKSLLKNTSLYKERLLTSKYNNPTSQTNELQPFKPI